MLRQKSLPVKTVGPAERMLIPSMIETMYQHKGIGLAAPQIGISEQILVADIGEGPVVLINPQIIKKSGSDKMEEGCLSIPGIVVKITRPNKIVVRYINEYNEPVQREFGELFARVIQHEMDHLKGKLIIDYASLSQQIKIKKHLKAIEEGRLQDLPQTAPIRSRIKEELNKEKGVSA